MWFQKGHLKVLHDVQSLEPYKGALLVKCFQHVDASIFAF